MGVRTSISIMCVVQIALAGAASGQCDMAKLISIGDAAGDEFGVVTVVSGDRAIVGAWMDTTYGPESGAAYLYEFDGTEWRQEYKFTQPNFVAGARFGAAAAVTADLVLIGAPADPYTATDAGGVHSFHLYDTGWGRSSLYPADAAAGDAFGAAVAMTGGPEAEVAIVGAPGDDDRGSGSGAAYIFNRDGSTWSETTKLVAPDGASGDRFGDSVAIGGTPGHEIVVIGAPGDDDHGLESGSAYVYAFDGVAWHEEWKLLASDGEAKDGFGAHVALGGPSGDEAVVVGARLDDDLGRDAGAAYVFRRGHGTWSEEQKLRASNGREKDTFGTSVSMLGDVVLVGSGLDDDNGNDAGSAYVFRFNGSSWVERTQLLAADGESSDEFGCSVALGRAGGDDVAFVGAWEDDDAGAQAGATYVYHFTGNGWREDQKLVPTDGRPNRRYGFEVDIEEDVAVVGAWGYHEASNVPGAVYVYRRNGDTWEQEQKVHASDGLADDLFGEHVAMRGDVFVTGVRRHDAAGDNAGCAYVFRYDGSTWVEEQKLLALDAEPTDTAGQSVGIDGAPGQEVVIVGAWGDDDNGSASGSLYVWRNDGVAWAQEQKLLASDGESGDAFGIDAEISVGPEGDVIIVGSTADEEQGGAAYIFRFNGAMWEEEQKLVPPDGAPFDHFGSYVTIDGNVAIVGAIRDDDSGFEAGAAYVYRFNGVTWDMEQKLLAPDGDEWDFFGSAVTVVDDIAVVAADADEVDGDQSGSAYVFRFDGATWVFEEKIVPADAGYHDVFGQSVALSGGRLIVGAELDRDNGGNAGSAYVYGGRDDCNHNGVLDCQDIMTGTSEDENGNYVPDECEAGDCLADIDGSGAVDFGDVLAILSAWGNPGGPEDLDDNGFVDFGDLLIVLGAWGPCVV